MDKYFECLGEVPRHRKMESSICLVPFQSDAQILRPFIFNDDLIMLIEDVQ